MMNESGSNIESVTDDFDNESIIAAVDAVSAELVMGNNEGGFHNDDIISSDNSDSDDVIKAIIKGGKKGVADDEREQKESVLMSL